MKKILNNTNLGLNFSEFKNEKKEEKMKKTLVLSIDAVTHEIIQKKFFDFHFENHLIGRQTTETFLLSNLLKNIEKMFLKKYGEILTPNDEYLSIYKRRRGRRKDGEKSTSYAVIMDIKYIDLLYCLIHTKYVNEYEKLNIRRYVPGEFFNEVVYEFLKYNKLELIKDEGE